MRTLTDHIVTLLLLASAGIAQPSLNISIPAGGTIRAGNTLTVQAALSGGGASVAAFQLNFASTTGGQITPVVGSVAASAGKQITCGPPPTFICVVYGLNANVIPDGVVATWQIAIPANATPGPSSIQITSPLSSDPDGSAVVTAAGSPVNFTLKSPLSPCDLNADDVTNVQDVLLALNQIFGASPGTADLDADGRVTVADLMRIVTATNGGGCRTASPAPIVQPVPRLPSVGFGSPKF